MIRVFFSYSHKDEELRNELEKHLWALKRKGIIETWKDITPDQRKSFLVVSEPLIEWLNENCSNPHTKVIVDNGSAEFLTASHRHTTDKFIKD